MEIADILSVNSKIDVQVNGRGVFYKSAVQELTSDYIAIYIPSHRGSVVYLVPGDSVKGRVYSKDAQYVFNSTVLGTKMDRILLFLLAVPSKLKRIQMRDYVRVKTMIPLYYCILKDDILEEEDQEETYQETDSIDISGGGVRFIAGSSVVLDDLIKIKFTVQNYEGHDVKIETMAKVKRKEPARQRGKAVIGVSFEKISERDRDILIGFLFRKLLEQRRLEVKE